jgi:UDP-N-acetylglucosamine acyltransferase
MPNASTLAGHVTVEDWAQLAALAPVHQFVKIGAHSYIGGGTTVTQDVMPFSKTSAARDVHAYGANSVGLERRGFSKERVGAIQKAFRILLAAKLNTTQALERIEREVEQNEDVKMLVEFIRTSERGVLK